MLVKLHLGQLSAAPAHLPCEVESVIIHHTGMNLACAASLSSDQMATCRGASGQEAQEEGDEGVVSKLQHATARLADHRQIAQSMFTFLTNCRGTFQRQKAITHQLQCSQSRADEQQTVSLLEVMQRSLQQEEATSGKLLSMIQQYVEVPESQRQAAERHSPALTWHDAWRSLPADSAGAHPPAGQQPGRESDAARQSNLDDAEDHRQHAMEYAAVIEAERAAAGAAAAQAAQREQELLQALHESRAEANALKGELDDSRDQNRKLSEELQGSHAQAAALSRRVQDSQAKITSFSDNIRPGQGRAGAQSIDPQDSHAKAAELDGGSKQVPSMSASLEDARRQSQSLSADLTDCRKQHQLVAGDAMRQQVEQQQTASVDGDPGIPFSHAHV